MTLRKAIEILQDLLTEGPYSEPNDRREAVKLGIEALREVKASREEDYIGDTRLLPGETEE